MKNKSCVNTERKYGLWSYNEEKNIVVRKCKCCGIEFFYPATKTTLNQIIKQYDAIPLIQVFLETSIDDPNLIKKLYDVLKNAVDYVEDTSEFAPKSLLNKKLQALNSSKFITDENKIIIENFRIAIESDNNDLFFDTMEVFEELNADSLTTLITEEKHISRRY